MSVPVWGGVDTCSAQAFVPGQMSTGRRLPHSAATVFAGRAQRVLKPYHATGENNMATKENDVIEVVLAQHKDATAPTAG